MFSKIVIALIQGDRVTPIRDAIAEHNTLFPQSHWGFFELEAFNIAGIPVSRIAIICDEVPQNIEISIEAVLDGDRYCPECFKCGNWKKLPPHNKSGYCAEHQDKNPKRSQRKRKM